MRIVMMGTGPFAVPTLERLYGSPHAVLALVTRPPRPIHGKSRAEANPMRELAAARGTPVFEPASINEPESLATLASYRADLFVVCDYGQILSRDALALARLGGVNLHASLLPRYRGAAPINWAILNGETTTGVTVIHMTPKLDAGPAIVQVSTPIGANETASELEPRLAALEATAVLEAIEQLDQGTVRAIEQDSQAATRAPRLTKEQGQVDWSRRAEAIHNQVRAFDAWPKTFTFWRREGHEPLRLILERVRIAPAAAEPGSVVEAHGEVLVVAAGQQGVAIERIQPAGKRGMTISEFLRGYPLHVGERLG